MSDLRSRPAPTAPARPEPEPTTADLVDTAIRKLVTAIVAAGALIGLAIYAQPGPPRYQVSVSEGQIVRIDSRNGTVIACDNGGAHCAIVLRHGKHLDRSLPAPPAPAPAPAPAAAPALPAPATH